MAIFGRIRLDDPVIAATFRDLPTALAQVRGALTGRDHLPGERYPAADLLIGGDFAHFRPLIPDAGPIGPWIARCQGCEAPRRARAGDSAGPGGAA